MLTIFISTKFSEQFVYCNKEFNRIQFIRPSAFMKVSKCRIYQVFTDIPHSLHAWPWLRSLRISWSKIWVNFWRCKPMILQINGMPFLRIAQVYILTLYIFIVSSMKNEIESNKVQHEEIEGKKTTWLNMLFTIPLKLWQTQFEYISKNRLIDGSIDFYFSSYSCNINYVHLMAMNRKKWKQTCKSWPNVPNVSKMIWENSLQFLKFSLLQLCTNLIFYFIFGSLHIYSIFDGKTFSFENRFTYSFVKSQSKPKGLS